MPHVRLLGIGRKDMTGMLGQHEFKDGVSVKDLPEKEARRLRCILECVSVTGEELHPVTLQTAARKNSKGLASPATVISSEPTVITSNDAPTAALGTPASLSNVDLTSQDEGSNDAPTAQAAAPAPQNRAPLPILKTEGTYTREELEQIADSSGINGLRVIGDPLNLRATSIAALIDKILATQSKA